MRPRTVEVIDDRVKLELGPMVVDVMHTPGHSRGSVCFRTGDLCFAGDTVFRGSIGQAIFPGGDRVALRTSVRTKLLGLPDHVRVFPGHGTDTTVEAERTGWEAFVSRG